MAVKPVDDLGVKAAIPKYVPEIYVVLKNKIYFMQSQMVQISECSGLSPLATMQMRSFI